MIDRIDEVLLTLYRKPLILLGLSLIPTLLGFGLYLLAPQVDQTQVFYLPLLGIHRAGLIAAVIGLTLSLVFYAQHYPVLHSLVLFAVVGGLVLGAMAFVQTDDFRDVQHRQTTRIGGQVFHLGYVRSAETVPGGDRFLLQSYLLYECDTLGLFCEAVGRDIVPSLTPTRDAQNLAVMRVVDGVLLVLDGGDMQTVLFAYDPA